MAITWATVVAVAPPLTSASATIQALVLAMVDRQIDDEVWTDMADDGRVMLAAHLGTIFTSGGYAPGAISSEGLGPMSRGYTMPPGITSKLSTTKYGLAYLQLIDLLPTSLGMVP